MVSHTSPKVDMYASRSRPERGRIIVASPFKMGYLPSPRVILDETVDRLPCRLTLIEDILATLDDRELN